MNKLIIPIDKANHIIYGYGIYFLSSFLFSWWISLSIVILISAVKEIIFDKLMKKGNPDLWDFILTIVGALPILIIQLIK